MDPRVDQVVLRALEKERERRFQTAGEVKTRVENITANPAQTAAQSEDQPGKGVSAANQPVQPWAPSGEKWMPSTSGRAHSRVLVSTLLVGLSLLAALMVFFIIAVGHVPPAGAAVLLMFIAVPASAGTFLGLSTLQNAARPPIDAQRLWLTRVSAFTWPILLCDAALFLTVILSARNLELHLLRQNNSPFTVLATIAGMIGIAALNWSLIREWVKRWRVDPAASPLTDIRSHIARWPRLVVWGSGPVLVVLWLFLLRGAFHYESRSFEPVQVMQLAQPTAPSGYATPSGLIPGDNWTYHSGFSVPAGYVLTLTTTLWSNQVPIKTREPNSAFFIAPLGNEAHGHLTWKLIGNAALADGAPLAFSVGADESADAEALTFHVVTPEPVAVDWVSAPQQLWPPENGHTRFLLVKGNSAETGGASRSLAESRPAAPSAPEPAGGELNVEWAVGIETRVDPIPPQWLHGLSKPQVGLGTNWADFFKRTESAQLEPLKPGSQTHAP